MIKNLHKWIFASVGDHFRSQLSDVHFHIEGVQRQTEKLREWVEYRMDGPYIKKVSSNCLRVVCEINFLITTSMDNTSSYRHQELCGEVASLFTDIPIYKKGIGPDDDNSYVFCLKLDRELYEETTTTNFGQVRNDTRLLQSTVEDHYKSILTI